MTPSFHPSSEQVCIHELARRIDTTAAARWRAVVDRHRERLQRLFASQPDAARAMYLRLLFRPIARELADEGLEVYPRLPGGDPGQPPIFADDRLCRHWSVAVVCTPLDRPVGSLVTAAPFDTTRFAVGDKPLVFGLKCVGIDAVRRALHRLWDGPNPAGTPRREAPWIPPIDSGSPGRCVPADRPH